MRGRWTNNSLPLSRKLKSVLKKIQEVGKKNSLVIGFLGNLLKCKQEEENGIKSLQRGGYVIRPKQIEKGMRDEEE